MLPWRDRRFGRAGDAGKFQPMAVARGFNNVAIVFGGMARQEISMLAEKRLQIRRQQFTEAGCRPADVGLHDYNSTKRIHRTPSILWAAGLQPITFPASLRG
jgi:hypothetical protein